jgi:hypothetical protein
MLDHLIIGSGMSAVHAALTLLHAGENVSMLDIGVSNENPDTINMQSEDFYSLRKSDEGCSTIFLGQSFEGVFWGDMEHTLTVPRRYIIEETENYLPYESCDFNLMQSASKGGLGNAWGAGACPYVDAELTAMGLPIEDMRTSYRKIASRIGLCGTADDASRFFALRDIDMDPPMEMDPPISALYNSYLAQKKALSKRGPIYMGKSPMAVITKPREGRRPYSYSNMDFYNDIGSSVYRPSLTFNELRKFSSFTYLPKRMALSFTESNGGVHLRFLDLAEGGEKSISVKKLYLGAGALGSARIALRSFRENGAVPLLTNDHSVATFIKTNSLGSSAEKNKNSLGQLELFYQGRNPLETRMASLYTYGSLTLSRLIGQAPFLNYRVARKLLSSIQSSLIIASFNHPDSMNTHNTIELAQKKNTLSGDLLRINYAVSPKDRRRNPSIENKMIFRLLRMGCIPLVRRNMPAGSSAHYAGTIPIGSSANVLTQNADGLLSHSDNVYSIDGAGFNFLPANGLTLSLMANADRVVNGVLNNRHRK